MSKRSDLIVFISSTFLDLEDCRLKVEEALSMVNLRFKSMRFFGSKEGEPKEECIKKVSQCNLYIGIIGHRYGNIPHGESLSITELEYEKAKSMRIPRRIYLASNSVLVRAEHLENSTHQEKLQEFRSKIKAENTTPSFDNPDHLATLVLADLSQLDTNVDEIESFKKTKYFPCLKSNNSKISFLGLDIKSFKRHTDVKLEKVYVMSTFSESERKKPRGKRVTPPPRDLFAEEVTLKSSEIIQSSLRNLLERTDFSVVLGKPGTGKSTLTKFITASIINNDKAVVPNGLSEYLPIRIILKRYAEEKGKNSQQGYSFLDYMKASVKNELQAEGLPDGFFEHYLENGRAFIIFDGLDEIFDPAIKKEIRDDIYNFSKIHYSSNKYLVTSRTFGYEEASFSSNEWRHFVIEEFNRKQIEEYVNKWYSWEEKNKQTRFDEIRGFFQQSRKIPEELLRNPLLLSLIVILYRAGCTLPESRLEIYKSCVGTLSEKWDAEGKRLQFPPEYNLVKDKKNAFAHLAFWMFQKYGEEPDKQVRIRYLAIVEELKNYLLMREFKTKTDGEAELAAEKFIEYASKRTVFVENEFSHKTFHEYFTALYLFRNLCLGKTFERLFGEITKYVSNDYWHVVLELLFQMINEMSGELIDDLVDMFITEYEKSPRSNYRYLLFPLTISPSLSNLGHDKLDVLFEKGLRFCLEQYKSNSAEPAQQKKEDPRKLGPITLVFAQIQENGTQHIDVIKKHLVRLSQECDSDEDWNLLIQLCYELERFRVQAFSDAKVSVIDLLSEWKEKVIRVAENNYVILLNNDFMTSSEKIETFFRCYNLKVSGDIVNVISYSHGSVGMVPFDSKILGFFSSSNDEEIASITRTLSPIVQAKKEVLHQLSHTQTHIWNRRRDVQRLVTNFSKKWSMPLTYFFLFSALNQVAFDKEPKGLMTKKQFLTKLLKLYKRGNVPQKFYSSLLINKKSQKKEIEVPAVSKTDLEIDRDIIEKLCNG